MNRETIYGAVLSDLRLRLAQHDAAIAAIEDIAGVRANARAPRRPWASKAGRAKSSRMLRPHR